MRHCSLSSTALCILLPSMSQQHRTQISTFLLVLFQFKELEGPHTCESWESTFDWKITMALLSQAQRATKLNEINDDFKDVFALFWDRFMHSYFCVWLQKRFLDLATLNPLRPSLLKFRGGCMIFRSKWPFHLPIAVLKKRCWFLSSMNLYTWIERPPCDRKAMGSNPLGVTMIYFLSLTRDVITSFICWLAWSAF